ncbi:hypothetical protein BDN72DRAFT_861602 [Pluteus cervinus]|uniref:Uncharacterized protein n=1 Tax=Pluteus cervinus TaxID=181527 RepID=A0ACD3AFN7_9AGAR|nr:hypothetical protein BDN72DRAFT_861602 [Pluteus cervinus]
MVEAGGKAPAKLRLLPARERQARFLHPRPQNTNHLTKFPLRVIEEGRLGLTVRGLEGTYSEQENEIESNDEDGDGEENGEGDQDDEGEGGDQNESDVDVDEEAECLVLRSSSLAASNLGVDVSYWMQLVLLISDFMAQNISMVREKLPVESLRHLVGRLILQYRLRTFKRPGSA